MSKPSCSTIASALALALAVVASWCIRAHDLAGEPGPGFAHDHAPAGLQPIPGGRLRIIDPTPQMTSFPPAAAIFGAMIGEGSAAARPASAEAFTAFKGQVSVRWDERWLYVESNGMPAHDMMIGITAWQQQVPLPKDYTAANAWRIPLHPVASKTPVSIKDRFLRGAIALAVNGIPIFNPQNNRGEISQEIGELDQWGGHCGRGDDYHYHAAPLFLEKALGPGKPIAFALDGYPIYGSTGPDGQPVDEKTLDAFRGKADAAGNYAYYASAKYPYVQGGFHGEITEAGGQVDPQPSGRGVRPALPPLRGARITGFTRSKDGKSYSLKYEIAGETRFVNYAINADGSVKFDFVDGRGQVKTETYSSRGGGGGGGGPARPDAAGGPWRLIPREAEETLNLTAEQQKRIAELESDLQSRLQQILTPDQFKALRQRPEPPRPAAAATQPSSTFPGFTLRSPDVTDGGGALPVEYTGDGDGVSPPLAWAGAPPGTRSFALIMHHIDPGGNVKWYWILYDIPADTRTLPKNAGSIGTLGNNSINGRTGYAPPHSKGPGLKTYVLTLYALSSPPQIAAHPADVNRDALLAAIADRTLAATELRVTYERKGSARP